MHLCENRDPLVGCKVVERHPWPVPPRIVRESLLQGQVVQAADELLPNLSLGKWRLLPQVRGEQNEPLREHLEEDVPLAVPDDVRLQGPPLRTGSVLHVILPSRAPVEYPEGDRTGDVALLP